MTPDEEASRLLRRALHAARPRPVLDPELLRTYTLENRAEEEALADSDSAHRLEILKAEDGHGNTD